MATLSSQNSLQDVMSRLAAFRAHARRGFEDEYMRKAARSRQAVGSPSHRRGLLSWVYVGEPLETDILNDRIGPLVSRGLLSNRFRMS